MKRTRCIFTGTPLNSRRSAGVPTSGVFKDTVVVGPKSQTEALLIADNPGPSLFHCHQQLHMENGFMALMEYV